MEQEFDKEIDALLRKLQPAGFLPDASSASGHLEADELAAFAENALPEAARGPLILHLADCGRCRKILSETILMNSEAAPVAVAAVSAPASVMETVPWYRRFFLFPNLAYVMGGLVLVFSGFLGYVVLRNATSQEATISQVTETQPAVESPNLGFDSATAPAESAAANTSAKATSTAANAATMPSSATVNKPLNTNATVASNDRESAFGGLRRDEVREAAPTIAPPTAATDLAATGAGQPVTAPKAKAEAEKDDKTALAKEAYDRADLARSNEELKARKMPGAGGPMKKSSVPAGPSRNMQTQFPDRAQNAIVAPNPIKTAGGKKFELRDGVWYDTAYRGQATTNVRRGTDAFLRLDSGLRSIAETIGGTSVIVWSGKAYRVQ